MDESSKITLLAIETSCDETGVSIVQKKDEKIIILADAVASQIDIHTATGGVVPEVAAREHVAVIQPMIREVMEKAGITAKDIDGIAVTVGPGLIPALTVGVQAARTLSYVWQKPLIPVHHIEGHIYSALLNQPSNAQDQLSQLFPALALIVSGGHTLLIEIKGHLQYKILGTTIDDAVGEAFDKVARLIGLPYPGGPEISKLAEKGNKNTFDFPRPMITSSDHNFSFSGLKTAVLYAWKKVSQAEQEKIKADVAASFQEAAIDVVVKKTIRLAQEKKYKQILLAGGVAANKELQKRLQTETEKLSIPLNIATKELFGDNATMIGQAGIFAYEANRKTSWEDIDATARISIEEFSLQR